MHNDESQPLGIIVGAMLLMKLIAAKPAINFGCLKRIDATVG
jgi:hypothetical protein